MKKKAIEKIPYLGLKKTSRKKGVSYIAVTAVKIIDHKKYLFVEVYQNSRKTTGTPKLRFVSTKEDFNIFWTDTGEWTRVKIAQENGLLWETDEEKKQAGKEKSTIQAAEFERICRFYNVKKSQKPYWWEVLEERQEQIMKRERAEAREKRYRRRQEALRERIRNTPELKKQDLLDYADENYFHKKHFLYYKKRGVRAEICCSACGGVTEVRWKPGISYESQFEKQIEEPQEKKSGVCQLCKALGEWKCQGKTKAHYEEIRYAFLGERYKKDGMLVRYIQLWKRWELQKYPAKDGDRMYGAIEELSGIEIARAYFEEGKKLQIDYHKHNPYTGKDFWDDCNLSGLSNICIFPGEIIPETYASMQETAFKYCKLREYQKAAGESNPIEYLKCYREIPQIEMLVNMGLMPIVQSLVALGAEGGLIKDQKADRLDRFLGIRKDKIQFLIQKKGSISILKILQQEYALDQNWTCSQIEKIEELMLGKHQIETAVEIASIQKTLNRIEKYAGCQLGTKCSVTTTKLRNTARTYFDYIDTRRALGYDLRNSVYQYPRNLQEAHRDMVQESNRIKADKRIREAEEKYPLIQKHYKRSQRRYFYQDDIFSIRPAKSAEEIIMEGRTLHHCVGGDNYLRKHNDDISTILFLRYRDQPEIPYITVEIEEEHIIQWYGVNDTKPDEKNIQEWLDRYVSWLGKNKIMEEGGATAEQQLLAYA